MISKFVLPILGAGVLGLFASSALAAPWTIDTEASKIDYTYTWSGAAAGGSFDAFSAEIDFDKDKLDASSVRVVIDMSSVSAAYSQVATELVKPEWFDVQQFPEAIFESTDFSTAEDGYFVANGTLTLRGVSQPSQLAFRFDSYGPLPGKPNTLGAVMEGTTTISRTAHEIGQGSWAATDTLADEVVVTVTVTAEQSTAP